MRIASSATASPVGQVADPGVDARNGRGERVERSCRVPTASTVAPAAASARATASPLALVAPAMSTSRPSSGRPAFGVRTRPVEPRRPGWRLRRDRRHVGSPVMPAVDSMTAAIFLLSAS